MAIPLFRRSIYAAWLLTAVASFGAKPAQACLSVRGPAPSSEDYVQSEQAVIFWDEPRHMEHFIRQADIRTDASDIGFIVPTPTVPELVEVDPAIFQLAADVGHPEMKQEIHYHTPWEIFQPVLWGPAKMLAMPFTSLLTGMSDQADSEPQVISEQDVAGYHAVILSASDADGLARWLKENGYVWTPEDDAWLKPYIDAHWTITAFKLNKLNLPAAAMAQSMDGKTPMITRALRMSFTTERPFYPYSEPGSKQAASGASPLGRALRVALLSSQRMRGEIKGYYAWPGELLFTGSPEPATGSVWKPGDWLTFAKLDGQMTLPNRLTYWLDASNPRPGKADVYFSPAPDQSTYRKTEIDYSLPLLNRPDFSHPLDDLGGLLLMIVLPGVPLYCAWWIFRRNRELLRSSAAPLPDATWRLSLNWASGLLAVLMGGFQCISCVGILFLMSDYDDVLPGKPLPAFYFNSTTLTPFLICLLFGALIYCGVRTFRLEPAVASTSAKQRGFYRIFDYAMAAAATLIGVGFSLGIIGALIFRLMPGQ